MISRVRLVLFPLVALSAFAAIGCGGSDDEQAGEVVLYYSADEYVARPIIERFEERTNINVLGRGDTEATKTTGLVQKLREEHRQGRPRADVFWSSEVFLTIQLADEGVLAPIPGAEDRPWPESLRDPEDRWRGFARRARVIVFNNEQLSPAQAPDQLVDLLDERWKGRIAMARPQFGTTRGHMGALVALWGAEAAAEWLERLNDNGVRLVDGNAEVVRAVAQGEAMVGLTDTDDVWSGQRNGWPVDLKYARHELPVGALGVETSGSAETGGIMLIPNTAARVKGGPNPENAERLIRYLLSEEVERALAESDSHNIPVRPELAEEYSQYAPPPALESIDATFEDIAEAMPEAMRLCREHLGG